MNKMIKTIKMFRGNSVFFKTLKKFILISIIPFLIISVFFSLHYYRTMKTEYTDLASNDYSRIYRVFDQLFSSTDHIFYTLCSDPSLELFFSMPDPNNVNAQDYAQLMHLNTLLNTQANIFDSIYSIQLYRDNEYILSSAIDGFVNNSLQNVDTSEVPSTMEVLLPCTITDTDGKTTRSFCICYNYYYLGRRCGYVVINIEADTILRELPKEYVLSVFNFQNTSVFSNDPDFEIKYSDSTASGEIPSIKQENSALQLSSRSRNNTICLYTHNIPGMHISSIIYMILLCLLLSLLTAFIISLIVSVDSYHMLQKIIFNIDSCDENSIQQHASINELTYISDNIIHLHAKNQSLETVLANKMNEMRQMQNTMLQMQFTPHFLFNTLNAVNLIALRELGPENEIEHITVLLCDLLSLALNTNRYMISVKEELDYTKKYVEIEQIKSKNDFDTFWDIDPQILEYKIPKLIFQPLVENAFRHGIKYLPPEKRGKLIITGRQENTSLIFEIEDNGPGIHPEKLQLLQDQLENNTISKNHIGLANVNSRIRLFYGDIYGLHIFSKPSQTIIRITIPKNKFE